MLKESAATDYPLESQTADRILFFPSHNKNIRVNPSEIIYADTCRSCTTVHLTNHRQLTGICSLTDLHKRLSGKGFLRIHKSHLVNTSHITAFYGNTFVLEGDFELPIGREYRKEVRAHLDLVGSKSRLYI